VQAQAQKQKRLSDWLLEQKATQNAYPLGLSWRVPEEMGAQSALRIELLRSISGFKSEHPETAAVERLKRLIESLPVTGRVPVAVADLHWLQANPARDPILLPGHSVDLPQRPATVTVITGDGRRCTVNHVSGRESAAYIETCDPDNARDTDWVWIAQPDGRVQRWGNATWNREKQDEPAPGAWLWAPARGAGWPQNFSERFIAFLATQGPAPDSAQAAGKVGELPTQLGSPSLGSYSPGLNLLELVAGSGPSAPTEPAEISNARMPMTGVPPIGPSRDLGVSSSDWGSVGLLQTPTARMRATGHFSLNFSHTAPYTHGNLFMQPLPWLEAGFRYTNVGNRLYGPQVLSGNQDYKDKSIDVKIRLWDESAYLPQAAMGLRDIGGTGLFAGEYLVASKRFGNTDWSLGLGWGYLGGRANLANPLGQVFDSFKTRQADIGQGGQFSIKSYFHGPAAIFGGVQYQTPWDRLILKLEYDGNNYQNEPLGNNQKQTSPLNVGAVYRWGKGVDLTLGVERGNTLTLGLALHTQLDGLQAPKLGDPPRVPVLPVRPRTDPNWSVTSQDLTRQTQWDVRSIERRGNELRVLIDDADATYWRERVDRAGAVLHRDAPESIEKFTLAYRERGASVAEHVIDRESFVAQKTQPVTPSERREPVIARAPQDAVSGDVLYTEGRKRFEHGLGISFIQTLGGPDAFMLYQLAVAERARLWLRDDTWIQTRIQYRIVDNYDKFRFTGQSNLPRVRTFQREYLTTSDLTLPNLQLTHTGKLTDNQYYSFYGGYLEEMFGGVGAEWLYRPYASSVAFGVDINEVKQRDFRQDFSFRDYRVATGHAALYWDTGWQDVLATVYAGRYLAGDLGATLNLSHVFKNGVTVGAFATKTNVSAEQFGEGSFDKGVYISIPFDAMFTRTTNTNANFLWKPLTRDGGAMLFRPVRLYDTTKARSDRTLWFQPAQPPREQTRPEDQLDDYQPKTIGTALPYTRVTPKQPPELWKGSASNEYRLVDALYAQQFRNIQVDFDESKRLNLTVSNDRLRPVSRAVGRAARTALQLAPLGTREIRVTLMDGSTPLAIYEFFDLSRLEGYFKGSIKLGELAPYVVVRYPNLASREDDPLARLGDLDPAASPLTIGALLPDTFSIGRVAGDFVEAGRVAAGTDWLKAGAIGAGILWGSSSLDKRVDRFSRNHADSSWVKAGVRGGNTLPFLGLGAAMLTALDGSNPRSSRVGYAATEAGLTALATATGLKYGIHRSRPDGSGNDAFPSRHTALAWAVATPFALEYNAGWLYGVAALSNLGRIGSRQHWVSDTVGGSLLGYGLGRIFWESSRNRAKGGAAVWLDPEGVKVGWELQ
jgi:hypothetical protein